MTTIACDGKVIAGDGQVTDNGTIHDTQFIKVVRLEDGRVAGFSGSIYKQVQAIDYLNYKRSEIDLGDAFEAVILCDNGLTYVMDGKGVQARLQAPVAIGSGAVYALTAMRLGKTASEAVAVAIDLDIYSSGHIIELGFT
jgi:ATP-dependent protease HslVU (ClpYQ) peptidase subunit